MEPFLSYVGSKRDLAPTIVRLFPTVLEAPYFEPCVGSGAVFFALADRVSFKGAVCLSDASIPVVNAYRAVQMSPVSVMNLLDSHGQRHDQATRDCLTHKTDPVHYYYTVRNMNKIWNGLSDAARFIYLNKKGFNGLVRFNRKDGTWNVPIGHGKRPLYDRENILQAAAALRGVPWPSRTCATR